MSTSAKSVKINPKQYQDLAEFSSLSGVPIEESVRETLSDFIECCVSVRTESIAKRSGQA
jgi:hypothetical protein